MTPRFTNGFASMADADLEVKTQSIIAALTGNAYYPTPVPALAEMSTALNEFSTALSASSTGNRIDQADKNFKKEVLAGMLQQLSSYVLMTANGNVPALVSSQFTLAKNGGSTIIVTKPENLVLSDGRNPGELEASFKRVAGARSYLYEYTQDPLTPESNWTTRNFSKTRLLLTGLESGKRYWVRVAVIGAGSQLVYSDPVSRLVQ